MPPELWNLILRKIVKIDINSLAKSRLLSRYFNELILTDSILRRKLLLKKHELFDKFSSVYFKEMCDKFFPEKIKCIEKNTNIPKGNWEEFIVLLYGMYNSWDLWEVARK